MLGKIAASLKKRMDELEWGKVRLGDLFEVKRGLSMYVNDKESFSYVSENHPNAIRLVQQLKDNNGIVAYVDGKNLPEKFKSKVEKAGQITINPDQPMSFYQDKEFIGNSVIIIDTSKLSKNICLYIVGEIQRIRKNSTWNDKFPKEQVKIAEISMPCKNGKIDFDFIESLISELEEEQIRELNAYLKASGMDNYILSPAEQQAIDEYSSLEFKEFDINKIFTIKNTKNILSREIEENSGTTPYLCASSENNSVSTYIKYKDELKDKGNCIFIGGKTFVVSYQESDFYSNDSHNLALYLNEYEIKKYNQLFLATCVNKSLSHKYSWGDSVSGSKIKKDKIYLPIKNNQIDFEGMDIFISAIHKLVIKDVVEYSNKKLKLTKKNS